MPPDVLIFSNWPISTIVSISSMSSNKANMVVKSENSKYPLFIQKHNALFVFVMLLLNILPGNGITSRFCLDVIKLEAILIGLTPQSVPCWNCMIVKSHEHHSYHTKIRSCPCPYNGVIPLLYQGFHP